MKRYLAIFIMLVSGVAMISAHPHDEGVDKDKRAKMIKEFRDFKMKYLAKEMDLTESQKQKFFELYEQLENKRDELYRPVMEQERKLRKDKDATEADYESVMEAKNKANLKISELEKNFDAEVSEFLSSKQIYKMKEGEKSFRQKLEEMRHNRKKKGEKKD